MRALLLAAFLLLPDAASAHAILVSSQPAPHATVPPGSTQIRLQFNSRIDQARSRLVLRAATGETTLALRPGGPPETLAARTDLRPGAYVIRWQVLAIDGHITRGDLPFTVQAP